MKYKFVDKEKMPDPDKIMGAKNFSKVVSGSGGFVGASIISSVLKGVSILKTAMFSTVALAAVATTTYLTYPEIFVETEVDESTELKKNPAIEDSSIDKSKPLNFDSLINELTDEGEAASDEVSETPEVKEESRLLLLEDDIKISAAPLPSLKIFIQHIYGELEYPREAIADSVQGYVLVRFKVNKKGIAEDFKISKSLGEAFDNEAIRVIRNYRNWQPATYNGEALDSFLKLKVYFRIE